MVADEPAARLLREYRQRHGREPLLGCNTVAHRDLGFCAGCVESPPDDPRRGASTELSGWRLLAMQERGFP